MERTEMRIDSDLVERARARARVEGRGEEDLVEEALRRYLDGGDDASFGEILNGVAAWQERHGAEPLSEEQAMELAVEEQHAHRRGE